MDDNGTPLLPPFLTFKLETSGDLRRRLPDANRTVGRKRILIPATRFVARLHWGYAWLLARRVAWERNDVEPSIARVNPAT